METKVLLEILNDARVDRDTRVTILVTDGMVENANHAVLKEKYGIRELVLTNNLETVLEIIRDTNFYVPEEERTKIIFVKDFTGEEIVKENVQYV